MTCSAAILAAKEQSIGAILAFAMAPSPADIMAVGTPTQKQ